MELSQVIIIEVMYLEMKYCDICYQLMHQEDWVWDNHATCWLDRSYQEIIVKANVEILH